jgi:hypothetical protein
MKKDEPERLSPKRVWRISPKVVDECNSFTEQFLKAGATLQSNI